MENSLCYMSESKSERKRVCISSVLISSFCPVLEPQVHVFLVLQRARAWAIFFLLSRSPLSFPLMVSVKIHEEPLKVACKGLHDHFGCIVNVMRGISIHIKEGWAVRLTVPGFKTSLASSHDITQVHHHIDHV